VVRPAEPLKPPAHLVSPQSLTERMLEFRDRLLANPRFQSWALRFPLTRRIARRRAGALFDLCAGFVYSQILLTCVQLRLFELLRDGPHTVHYLSAAIGMRRDATLTLLHAAAALQLVEWREYEKRCGLGRHGAALLGNPSLMPLISHHALLYEDLRDPVSLLRRECGSTSLGRFWAYARADQPAAAAQGEVSAYTALMSASQAFIAAEVLDAYDFGAHQCLLDVGGGDGTFVASAAGRVPHLRVICFDLPTVVERARLRFAQAGVAARAVAVGGDFLRDPLPPGADAVSLIRVLHDHDDPEALRILQRARATLGSNGVLIVAEPMSGTSGSERVADAYFGLYLFAMGSGKPRTVAALAKLLETAGFERPTLRTTRMPMNVRVLVARSARAKV
jgi:demethylspheroidene O-methyltransferase